MMASVSLIAALAHNRAIGNQGQLLCHLPEDLRYFREQTRGKAVIMGRKTWESLPAQFRPLPGRQNIVISRNAQYVAAGALCCANLEDAVQQATSYEVFVIGGEQIYALALPLAEKLYLTEIEASFTADAFFPAFNVQQWLETERKTTHDPLSGIKFSFVIYQKNYRNL